MPNHLLRRLAWATIGASIALAPRLLRHAKSIATADDAPPMPGPPAEEAGECDHEDDCECCEPDREGESIVTQQLTRYRHTDGSEAIHGMLLAEFQPKDRTTTLVVAFCPPFEQLPSVEAEAMDESGASVKVTQLLHNGCQLEVRLSQPVEEPTHIAIEFLASDADEMNS